MQSARWSPNTQGAGIIGGARLVTQGCKYGQRVESILETGEVHMVTNRDSW
jgi:hypothetical protein